MPSGVAAAAPVDALTEKTSSASKVKAATSHSSKANNGCSVARKDSTLKVTCGRNEYISLTYRFRVPGKAIRFRARVPVSESGTNKASFFGYEGNRDSRRRFTVNIGISGRGTWIFRAIRIGYRLPTAFDKRRCVTPGERARLSPWEGGFAGNLRKYAAVFETNGTQRRLSKWTHGFRFQVRAYRKCGSKAKHRVTFHQYRGTPGWWAYWG